MKRMVRNQNVWIALTVWGSFWLWAPFIDRDSVFDLVNGLLLSVGIGVLIAYAPGLWRGLALRQEQTTAGHMLVMGVLTVCFWFGAHRAWQTVWRWVGQPSWMSNHLFLAWCLWGILSGYVVHLTSVGAIDGRIPGRNLAHLAGWVVFGLWIMVVGAVFVG